jgi:acetyltransferase-like isoleucine patch superfamily enzyme
MNYKKHLTADVQSDTIGKNTTIWQFCVILKDAKIGNNCNINCNVFIENDVIIGDNVTIKSGAQIWDGLRIGNNVFIGPNATFTNDLLPRSKQYPESFAKTLIMEGASIGANATVLAGITIGEYAMIGAGSVITKNVPPFTLWYGNPAKHKGYVTKEGKVLSLDLTCKEGKKFKIINYEPVLND